MKNGEHESESQVLGRRELLRGTLASASSLALGAGAAGLLSGTTLADSASDVLRQSCVLTPAGPQGPYYRLLALERRTIHEGLPGLPTSLFLRVVRASDCAPVPGAFVDVWQTSATGDYSAIAALGTANQTYMRGYQVTGSDGVVRFETVYPGWYPQRTTHVHLKVYRAGSPTFTSQLYFPDAMTSSVYRLPPYALRGPRPSRNQDDPFFEPACVVSTRPIGDPVSLLRQGSARLVVGLTLALA